jgi:hypothetical protein
MLTLRDWQQQLQHAILAGKASDPLLQAVRRQGVIAQQRVGIYQDAYHLRLTEALASNYPAIAQYLGDVDFSALARAFAIAHPSCHASIRWFGDSLARFLHTQSPWSSNPVLHELAQFEWALRHTVDAADTPALEVADLRALPPDGWAQLQLALQPAASLMRLDWNATGFWSALVEGGAPPARQYGPQHWLVYRRQDFMAMWRSVGEDEARLLRLIGEGINFADLCEAMAEHAVEPGAIPAQAALLLHQWVDAGLLVDTTAEHH